jgi:predicted molibdopterin-dependent oxidoreductase YjgC
MTDEVRVTIAVDGRPVSAAEGTTVAAALVAAGVSRFRISVTGAPRGPLCAMGICHECRVTIDGVRHRRSCLVEVAPGMRIETGG